MINGAIASLNNKREEEVRDGSRVWNGQSTDRQTDGKGRGVLNRGMWDRDTDWEGENVLMLLMCGLI